MLEVLDPGKSTPREDYGKPIRPLRDSLDAAPLDAPTGSRGPATEPVTAGARTTPG
jgi:hypothetical protein